MQKKTIILSLSYGIPVLMLLIALANNWNLSAISVVTILIMVTTYLRAHEVFDNRAPGKYNTFASFIIGFTVAVAILLVDFFLVNYKTINKKLFDSVYTATIATGLIFAVSMFITDHKTHTPGNPEQRRSDIIFAAIVSAFLVAVLAFSLIVDINYTL